MATSVKQENRWRKLLHGRASEAEARNIQAEAATMQRKPRLAPVAPAPEPSRKQVRSWMRENADEYETATELAEGANAALRLPQNYLDDSEHWVWDEAAAATKKEEGHE